MLGTNRAIAVAGLGADPQLVARAFREYVLACGVDPVNRLEAAVEGKLSGVRALERTTDSEFSSEFSRVLEGVVATRPHRARLLEETPPDAVRKILREARDAHLGAADVPAVAHRLHGAPTDVRRDLAAELLHAAAPDRVALLARWVWNPERRTGILAEFGGDPPESFGGTQARLAEIRLELGALGFEAPTFAAVDVLLGLTYAHRLESAVDRSFQGGGIERLLPGSFPLATIVLGVRRRLARADR
jgi:hypothetical protein